MSAQQQPTRHLSKPLRIRLTVLLGDAPGAKNTLLHSSAISTASWYFIHSDDDDRPVVLLEHVEADGSARFLCCRQENGCGGGDGSIFLGEEPTPWLYDRSGGGSSGFECARFSCASQNDATNVMASFEARVEILAPPVVNLSPLLTACDDNEEEQLRCMQQVLDAAQDSGYFFITGVDVLAGLATKLLQELQVSLEAATFGVGEALEELMKTTLLTSTGTVKVSSVPPVHQPVVLPRWLPEDVVSSVLHPYYDEAIRVSMLIMEALLQDAVVASELFMLMRCVAYPPMRCDSRAAASRVLEPHSDKSWITLLATTDINGLEYISATGEAFEPAVHSQVAADYTAYKLLVNIGDAFHMKSRGQFLSRIHRARNTTTQEDEEARLRISVPLFVEPRPDLWPRPYVSDHSIVVPL